MKSPIRYRLDCEIEDLKKKPLQGVTFSDTSDGKKEEALYLDILGPPNTPVENKRFEIRVDIPKEYPFVPPAVYFLTPVIHTSIRNDGRVMLDMLNQDKDTIWRSSMKLRTILQSVVEMLKKDEDKEEPAEAEEPTEREEPFNPLEDIGYYEDENEDEDMEEPVQISISEFMDDFNAPLRRQQRLIPFPGTNVYYDPHPIEDE